MAKNGESRNITKEEKTALRAAIKEFPTQKAFCKKHKLAPATIDYVLSMGRASSKTIKRLAFIFDAAVV